MGRNLSFQLPPHSEYGVDLDVTKGRLAIIKQVVAELSPAGRKALLDFAQELVAMLKATNPTLTFGELMVYELIWEILILGNDPQQLRRAEILERYRAADLKERISERAN